MSGRRPSRTGARSSGRRVGTVSNALDRGLDVLEMLASRGEARVSDLVSELEVSRATAFRIMVTLESRAFVEHVPERHTWRLGRAIGDLASTLDSDELVEHASATLQELSARTHDTINLATVHRNRLVWASTIDSPHSLRMTTVVGDNVALHATAAGKAVLTTIPKSDWTRFLPAQPFPALTHRTKVTMEQLEGDVERSRERGWALDDEECELGGVCVAAPIVNTQGRAVGAVSISSTAGRLHAARREEWGLLVRDRCHALSQALLK